MRSSQSRNQKNHVLVYVLAGRSECCAHAHEEAIEHMTTHNPRRSRSWTGIHRRPRFAAPGSVRWHCMCWAGHLLAPVLADVCDPVLHLRAHIRIEFLACLNLSHGTRLLVPIFDHSSTSLISRSNKRMTSVDCGPRTQVTCSRAQSRTSTFT